MARVSEAAPQKRVQKSAPMSQRGLRIPRAVKLSLYFLLIIMTISVLFTLVAIKLISDRIVSEAQDRVASDLSSARTIYQRKLNHINDIVQTTGRYSFISNALMSKKVGSLTGELINVKESEGLAYLLGMGQMNRKDQKQPHN
jgi:two-component system NtrC family sensor kinase